MLLPVGVTTGWEILEGMENGGTEDRVRAEIVNPEPF